MWRIGIIKLFSACYLNPQYSVSLDTCTSAHVKSGVLKENGYKFIKILFDRRFIVNVLSKYHGLEIEVFSWDT